MHELPGMSGGLVLGLLNGRDAHCRRLGCRTVREGQERGGNGVHLLWGELELRHLQRWPERARITNLCGYIRVQVVIDAFDKQQLRNGLAADAAQLRREVFRLLDAVDLMATGTTILEDEPFSVLDLLLGWIVEMHVGHEIGL